MSPDGYEPSAVPAPGAGIAIGAGVAISSTALAMPSAMESMTCNPTLSGWKIPTSGDGLGVCTSITPAAVDADAGAGAEIIDASPIAAAATNAIAAQPRERVTRNT
jgi:hypothetical protein